MAMFIEITPAITKGVESHCNVNTQMMADFSE